MVHDNTGLLGFTTKHIYFSGLKKKFRIRHDRIVEHEPFADGFGIMREAQTVRPQSFRTGDGWLAYKTWTWWRDCPTGTGRASRAEDFSPQILSRWPVRAIAYEDLRYWVSV